MEKFEDILARCIDDIKSGRAGIADCLDRYPSLREQLEPLLRIALEIGEPADVKPSPGFKIKARVQLMDEIHGRQAVTKWPWSRYKKQTKPGTLRRRYSMANIILVIVLALCAAGGGTAYAAQDSLPGDALYTVKLGTEQLRMILPGDDVTKAERALSFAERRIEEMEALAERECFAQGLALAVGKYGGAMNMTLTRMERACNRGLDAGNITARVAEATARHLLVLDELWDKVPDEAKEAIERAMEVSERGRQNALAALAKRNTVMAAEMNLAAMQGRLNRVRARVQNGEALQIALGQFEDMARFGQKISQIAQETGLNITEVAALVDEATSRHLEVLLRLYDEVPEEAKEAVAQAIEASFRCHERIVGILAEMDVEVSQPPVIPEKTRERVKEILGWPDPPGPNVPHGGVAPGPSCPSCRR